MKTVLFVPGFKESFGSRDYRGFLEQIGRKGYRTKFVEIDWGRTKTIDDWLIQLETTFKNEDAQNTILAGFSFGAVTAFISAAERNPVELWLFSLSGAFAEDWPKMEEHNMKIVGKRRIAAFSRHNFKQLAPKVLCKALIFVGEIEEARYPSLRQRILEAKKSVKAAQLYRIANCGHDCTDPRYLRKILEVI